MTELTKPQRKVLELLRGGWQVRWWPGWKCEAVLRDEVRVRRVQIQPSTLKAMTKKGLITRTNPGGVWEYTIGGTP